MVIYMKEYLIYQDEKSQKFWSVVTDGATMHVNYGRLGTKGQASEKTFDSPEKCEKEAQKLAASKRKAGYQISTMEEMQSTKEESRRFGYSYDQWDEGKTHEDLCNSIINYKGFQNLKHITIANWLEPFDEDCQDFVDFILANKEKFAHIESYTFGDMDYEECEISWIMQANYEKFWSLPNLKHIQIQGSQQLTLGNIVSDSLKSIEIRCGGLPADVLLSIEKAKTPNLEKLNLYLGIEEYGFDCTLENIVSMLSNSDFPHLTYLGLCNNEMAPEITQAILDSKYAGQIKTLDISKSVFRDNSAQLILDQVNKLPNLELLDLEYHFMSKEMMKKLEELPFKVNTKDRQEPDKDDECYDSAMFTE